MRYIPMADIGYQQVARDLLLEVTGPQVPVGPRLHALGISSVYVCFANLEKVPQFEVHVGEINSHGTCFEQERDAAIDAIALMEKTKPGTGTRSRDNRNPQFRQFAGALMFREHVISSRLIPYETLTRAELDEVEDLSECFSMALAFKIHEAKLACEVFGREMVMGYLYDNPVVQNLVYEGRPFGDLLPSLQNA